MTSTRIRAPSYVNDCWRGGTDHTLGKILATIGYRYVHVASGIEWTNTSRNADLRRGLHASWSCSFRRRETKDPFALERAQRLSGRFTDTFLRTTGHQTVPSEQIRYSAWRPIRIP